MTRALIEKLEDIASECDGCCGIVMKEVLRVAREHQLSSGDNKDADSAVMSKDDNSNFTANYEKSAITSTPSDKLQLGELNEKLQECRAFAFKTAEPGMLRPINEAIAVVKQFMGEVQAPTKKCDSLESFRLGSNPKSPATPASSDATENMDYEAAMYEIGEIVRVARDNPSGLRDFLMANYPREWGLSKEEHRALVRGEPEQQASDERSAWFLRQAEDFRGRARDDLAAPEEAELAADCLKKAQWLEDAAPARCEIRVDSDCQEAFEANTKRLCAGIHDAEHELRKKPNGNYHESRVQAAWMAWQDCWRLCKHEPVASDLTPESIEKAARAAHAVYETYEDVQLWPEIVRTVAAALGSARTVETPQSLRLGRRLNKSRKSAASKGEA